MVHLHNWILPGMDAPGECYVKWNKPVREREIPYDFTCIYNLINKINYQTKEKQNRLTAVRGEEGSRAAWQRGMDWGKKPL